MDTPLSDTAAIAAGLERLRLDLTHLPAETDARDEGPKDFSGLGPIDYAALEFEVDRMRKRLAIWEIFMTHVRDGARTWPDVQRAMTPEDLEEIEHICDGVPLRDVLLHLR
jgi:hypothetical protein